MVYQPKRNKYSLLAAAILVLTFLPACALSALLAGDAPTPTVVAARTLRVTFTPTQPLAQTVAPPATATPTLEPATETPSPTAKATAEPPTPTLTPVPSPTSAILASPPTATATLAATPTATPTPTRRPGASFSYQAGSMVSAANCDVLTISGKVVDAAGSPLDGLTVELRYGNDIVRYDQSDLAGQWRFMPLAREFMAFPAAFTVRLVQSQANPSPLSDELYIDYRACDQAGQFSNILFRQN